MKRQNQTNRAKEKKRGRGMKRRTDRTDIIYGVKLYSENDMVNRSHLVEGPFEPDSIRVWKEFASKPGAVCFDIGAYSGLYSIVAAKLGADVFAFEPNPAVYERLVENVELNQVGEKVSCLKLAVGDKRSTVSFKLKNKTVLTSAGHVSADGDIKVDQVKLDSFVDRFSFKNLAIVKMDVERYEMQALSGMKETISKHKPAFIIEALERKLEKELTEFFYGFGYSPPVKLDDRNLFFVYPQEGFNV